MSPSPFLADSHQNRQGNVPILPSSSKPGEVPPETHHEDPMDLTPPAAAAMGPPNSSPEMDNTSGPVNGAYGEISHGHNEAITNGVSAAAATSSQQPKVVQTAFIHKLYKYA